MAAERKLKNKPASIPPQPRTVKVDGKVIKKIDDDARDVRMTIAAVAIEEADARARLNNAIAALGAKNQEQQAAIRVQAGAHGIDLETELWDYNVTLGQFKYLGPRPKAG
jgi:hypothetical protein